MIRIILLFSLILFSSAVADETKDIEEFKQRYSEFKELYQNSDDFDLVVKEAEKFLRYTQRDFGKNHYNTAIATYNLAALYNLKGGEIRFPAIIKNKHKRKALNLYKTYFNTLSELNTEYNQSHIDQYLEYVKIEANYNFTDTDNSLSQSLLDMAVKIELSPIQLSELCMELGLIRSYTGQSEQSHYFTQAESLYLESIRISKIQNELNETELLKRYDSIARFYISIGKHSDAKKFNALAIDIEGPQRFSHRPILRVNPMYPARAARNGVEGWVLVEFDVNTEGSTENIKVIESSHEIFDESAVVAAKKYKYLPAMKDGYLTTAENVKVKIEYGLVK